MSRRPPIEPGQVWFVDFDPVRGREQGKDGPVVSGNGWVITEQIRTVSVGRAARMPIMTGWVPPKIAKNTAESTPPGT